MEKEFKLSERIQDEYGDRCLKLEDVKEFIKRLKCKLKQWQTKDEAKIGIEAIDKLSGGL